MPLPALPGLLQVETLVIELLLIVSIVAMVVQKLRIPYTVALVVVGLIITIGQDTQVNLDPTLILALFVPPLIFEAAFHIQFRDLRENLTPIMALAIPGVLISTFLVGFMVSKGVGLNLTTGLLFGALISATDPVAVVSLFRSLGAPKRLTTIVEGESLFNDGTAVVIFKILTVVVVGGAVAHGGGHGAETGAQETFNLLQAVVQFLIVAVGGLAVGGALGWIISLLIARVDDYLIETTLTTVLAFGSYLVAEEINIGGTHLSGILAVVAAGIVCGNVGPRGMSPTTRIVLYNFWEYLAFLANSLIFLLIGLDVDIPLIIKYIGDIGIAVAAVLIARLVVVYGLNFIVNALLKRRAHNSPVPMSYQHVSFWGGLRGAISLALVLSLPYDLPEVERLRVMSFGVVLFTLLIQGTTMSSLLARLGLTQRKDSEVEYERRHGRLIAARAGYERLKELHSEGLISHPTWQQLEPEMQDELQIRLRSQTELLEAEPDLSEEARDDARREGLRAQRAMLSELWSNGVISEHVYNELVREVDMQLKNDRHGVDEMHADAAADVLPEQVQP